MIVALCCVVGSRIGCSSRSRRCKPICGVGMCVGVKGYPPTVKPRRAGYCCRPHPLPCPPHTRESPYRSYVHYTMWDCPYPPKEDPPPKRQKGGRATLPRRRSAPDPTRPHQGPTYPHSESRTNTHSVKYRDISTPNQGDLSTPAGEPLPAAYRTLSSRARNRHPEIPDCLCRDMSWSLVLWGMVGDS